MKIAIYSDNFYPESSGITDSVITLAKNLAKRGHEIEFFAPKYSVKDFKVVNFEPKEINLGDKIKINRFGALSYPTSTKQGRLVVPSFWRWLKVRNKKIDIIHTQDFFGCGLEALITAKVLQIPLVGTNHTPITEFLDYSPINSDAVKKLSRNFVSWYYNKCRFVTAPSQNILDEMKQYGLKSPTQVVSNPIELENFSPVNPEVKKQLKQELNFSNFTVLCSGRLAPEKHVDVIIKAVDLIRKEIKDINLIITGGGSAETSLKELVNDLQLNGYVKFLGRVNDNELIKIYQAADVYVIASTAETQSISLMKAMAVGMPAIGVNAWALPEYIKENNGFIVDVGDYKSIAEKIVNLYKDENLRKKLGDENIKAVESFSEENITDQWIKIYSDIIKQK